MQTVAIVNQKGGSGKSTLAECLAVAADEAGLASAILDMDPQGTVYEWSKRRKATAKGEASERGEDPATVSVNPPVLSVSQANYRDEWQRLKDAGADLVIIDTPARLDTWAMNAAELADLVIIPAKPTVKDLERVEASIKLACTNGAKPVFVLLNQARPQASRTEQAESFIRQKKIPVCPARFGYRVAFEDADAFGQTPQEYDPRGDAAQEIAQVYRYTAKLLRDVNRQAVSMSDSQNTDTLTVGVIDELTS